jgi:hypothetical protein
MKNRSAFLGLVIAASFGLSAQAQASNLDYSYLQISSEAIAFDDDITVVNER